MNPVTQNMVLGFYNDVGTYTVYAKQGDTNRFITFELVDGLIPYVVEDTTFIYIKEKFSTGQILPPIEVDKSGLSQDGSELTVPFTSTMLGVSGVAQCEISFIKSDVQPVFNSSGTITSPNAEVLTTQNFNIYIEPSVYEDGCLTSQDQNYISILLPLVINIQRIEAEFESYEANEAVRIENENIRINNESSRISAEDIRQSNESTRGTNEADRISAETDRSVAEASRVSTETARVLAEGARDTAETSRARTEQERVAREGAGNYAYHDDISYEDTSGLSHTVQYKDSRVGVAERLNAIGHGGTYIDTEGDIQTLVNEYTNLHGQTVVVDDETLEGMTVMAIGAMAKEMAEEALSDMENTKEHAARATTSETNAASSATAAAASAAQAQEIVASLSGTLRPMGTIAFENLPLNPASGEMYNVSDSFTTDDRFKEGAGHYVALGANVYYTADGYWDVLAGTSISDARFKELYQDMFVFEETDIQEGSALDTGMFYFVLEDET